MVAQFSQRFMRAKLSIAFRPQFAEGFPGKSNDRETHDHHKDYGDPIGNGPT